VIERLQQQGYRVSTVCQVVKMSRSSYYYRRQVVQERELETALNEVVGQFPTYGSRRITHQLRRPPYRLRVNRKHVQRLMRQKGLLRAVSRRKYGTTDSRHAFRRYPNRMSELEVVRPDQVWVSDITYIRLQAEFVFLAVIMDVFTRAIRGWNLSRLLTQELTLTPLRQALQTHRPEIHHSDQGIQYAAPAYVRLLEQHEVQISMAAQGVPEENGYAERLIRTIKEEEVDLADYRDFAEASDQIGRFIEKVYMHKRIHSSLGYLTPVEFELAWRLALSQPAQPPP
jgi:transposase InsO family protein